MLKCYTVISKEQFVSFPLNKRYLIAASDFARAASLIKSGLTDLALDSIRTGCNFLKYLAEDDISLAKHFPPAAECEKYVRDGNHIKVYNIYLDLMELGGVPKLKVREAEKRSV